MEPSPTRREPTPDAAEVHFRTVADTAPVLLWTAGADERRDFLNQPWLDFTGRALGEELGAGWLGGIHPDDRARCLAAMRAACAAREPFELEYRLRRADGLYRWFLDRGTPRFAPDGAFLGYVGACTDITERKRAEADREDALTGLAALLRVSRRLASEADTDALLTALVHEAVEHLRADAGTVHRWQDEKGKLVVVCNTLLPGPVEVAIGQGAIGQAAERRAPVVIDQYEQASNVVSAARQAGVRTALAIPLLHQNRLLGALGVFSRDPKRRFGPADVESLELLGAMAAATLVGVERARLDGALLAAYTAQHEVHNRLALTMGYVELISMSGKLPAELREAAGEAVSGVAGAVEVLNKLGQLRQLSERDWGPNAHRTIDLGGSLG